MGAVFSSVMRGHGVLGVAIAVAVALAVYALVRSVVFVFPMALIGKADDDVSFRSVCRECSLEVAA